MCADVKTDLKKIINMYFNTKSYLKNNRNNITKQVNSLNYIISVSSQRRVWRVFYFITTREWRIYCYNSQTILSFKWSITLFAFFCYDFIQIIKPLIFLVRAYLKVWLRLLFTLKCIKMIYFFYFLKKVIFHIKIIWKY